MIRAGKITEINFASGNWVFIDIGFANNSKSCGLLFGDEEPQEVLFNEAVEKISHYIQKSELPVNLVIEAPLSVAFDRKGNPKGRAIEKQKNKTRYWYVGLGCTVMIAALYLVRALHYVTTTNEVRLFEGFVSFKDKSKKSNHSNDVLILRNIIKEPHNNKASIIAPETLKMDSTDEIKSAFMVAGLDCGIPPVLMQNG